MPRMENCVGRCGPQDRGDYRQLGNRMVSLWPVRGGPVIRDGVVYFGAGIWPSMGVFVKAVDADSGEVKWVNGDINYLSKVRIDHNLLEEAALSPQGYCLFADGKVVVPNGRSMPARFNPETGELLYFVQGYRHGDSRVTCNGTLLFVGEKGVVSLKDGREVGDRWVSAGDKAPNGGSSQRDLFEGPFYQYKFMAACDYRSIFEGGVAYGMGSGSLHGWDVAAETSSTKKSGNLTIHPPVGMRRRCGAGSVGQGWQDRPGSLPKRARGFTRTWTMPCLRLKPRSRGRNRSLPGRNICPANRVP